MTRRRLFFDLLASVGRAASTEAEFTGALKTLLALTGATAGALRFTPERGASLVVTAGARRGSAVDTWLRARLDDPVQARRVRPVHDPPSGWRGRAPVLLAGSLGERAARLGHFLLLGSGGPRGLSAASIPPGFAREMGLAMERIWRLHQRTLRLQVINEVTALTAANIPLGDLYRAAAEAVGRLVPFEAFGFALVDRERRQLRVLDVARSVPLPEVAEYRIPLIGTLTDWVATHGAARRVDDPEDPAVPPATRELLASRQVSSAVLTPLFSQGAVIGALIVGRRDRHGFTDGDVEVLGEVARPLAAAIERARLHAEITERAEESAALNRTSQLVTARLDLGSLLETISRAATELIGSAGCGIGLWNAERTAIDHVAAHGVRSGEWHGSRVPAGRALIEEATASGRAVRSDDLGAGAAPGIASMLSVPLRVGGEVIGVISAFAGAPGFFAVRHQALLERFADQAATAIQNARLFEESQRRTRETEALLGAVRAVNQSLEVGETIRLILNQAREVLGVQSASVFTLEPTSGELVAVASLDLDLTKVSIRNRVGEGITGEAVAELRPIQSADLYSDPRVRYRQLSAGSGFRSMLAAPLLVGDEAIGALTVLRRDVHHFTPEEESLTVAFADQAAMALEHARLFSSVRNYSEQLEAMVAGRTRELDEQKRLLEVVLETLPLGLFVLDGGLRVVSANREGAALVPFSAEERPRFFDLVPAAKTGGARALLETVLAERAVRQIEERIADSPEPRTLRLTAAPLEAPGGGSAHALVLVEDITLQKRLEAQMLLTERLTTAGRLAAGVAHELNNPLATIAGCAEALKERAQDPELAGLGGFKDFPGYLSLIEEEAYRCKEITGSLLQFVREPGVRRAPTDLNALVEKALELLRHQPRFAASQLDAELDAALPLVVGNEGQLRQVFLGLSANALEAMDGRGTLTVRTRRRPSGGVEVSFEDQGPGIPNEILPRIFDPFFTTKPPGQGTGLGLAIAQGIAADHRGRIEVVSGPGAGATFRVILPITSGEDLER
jgi:two-component system, NtrC family, sensor kinase